MATRLYRHPARQRGAIALVLAVMLLIGLGLFGAVHVGYVAYAKRDVQKAVDLAVLSGVQSLAGQAVGASPCQDARQVATALLRANLGGLADTVPVESLHFECGLWLVETDATGQAQGVFREVSTLPSDRQGLANALRLRAELTVGGLLGGWTMPVQRAEAMASVEKRQAPPWAIFSVESRLLRLSRDGLLGRTLQFAGLDPQRVTLLDSSGVAQAQVTPSGLLRELGLPVSAALGVGTTEELTRVRELTVSQLLSATAAVVARTTMPEPGGVAVLREFAQLTAGTPLGNQVVDLFGEGGLMLPASDEPGRALAALDTGIEVSQLARLALLVANGQHAVQLPGLDIAGITGGVSIVEPPAMGIGGVGTTARSAGIRATLNANLLQVLQGPSVQAEVSASTGTLTGLCETPNADQEQARFNVRYDALKLCVGRFDPNTGLCSPGTVGLTLGNLSLLGGVTLPLNVSLPILPAIPLSLGDPGHTNSTLPRQVGGAGDYLWWDRIPAGTQALSFLQASGENPPPGSLASVLDVTTLLGVHRLLDPVNSSMQPSNANWNRTIATTLLGMSGQSITGAVNVVSTAASDLRAAQSNVQSLSIPGLVLGTLGALDGLLKSLGSLLGDIVCGVLGSAECRNQQVRNALFQSAGDRHSSLTLLSFLELERQRNERLVAESAHSGPLMTAVNQLLGTLLGPGVLSPLGLQLGETDLTLHHLHCGPDDPRYQGTEWITLVQ